MQSKQFFEAMSLQTSQALLAGLATWLLWRLLTVILTKSDLDNIRGPESSSFIHGNVLDHFGPKSWDWHAYNFEKFGRVKRLWGPFNTKQLWVSDPLALHYIFVKEAHVYEEPHWVLERRKLALGNGLLSVTGDHHKKQRKMLNPVFSVKHMKIMIPLFYEIIHKVSSSITEKIMDQSQELDVLSWVSRAALEIIGVAGLGYSFESFDKDTHPSEYAQAVKELAPTLSGLNTLFRLYPMLNSFIPDSIKGHMFRMIPSKRVKKLANIIDTMHLTSCKVLQEKLRALKAGDDATVRQIGEGKDIISILIRANQEAALEDRLPDDEVLGQMSTLIFAAFDTTSSALSRIIYLLSRHPDVQEKLRAEVTMALSNGDIPFEELVNLPYLEAVCRETLRVYPPVPELVRECLQDSILPLSTPIITADGKEIDCIHVTKGTNIFTGFMECNRDKLIWGDDALEWKPERWLKPLPGSVAAARVPGVYANLMTFSGGSRSCIGFKFSQLEMKVVLAVLLRSFIFEPVENKEIVFNMAGIVWPRVVGGSGRPELPMKVSLVKNI